MNAPALWNSWTYDEVKSRMIDANRVLARMPEVWKPKRLVAAWPDRTYARDRLALRFESDYEEAIVADEMGEEELRSRYGGRALRVAPAPIEIAKMEEALQWPARYLDNEDAQILNRWADEVFRTGGSEHLWKELGITKRGLNKRVVRIASIVAAGLRRDRVIPR